MLTRRSHNIIAQARAQGDRLVAQAHQAAALTIREMEAQAREEAMQHRRSAEILEQQSLDQNKLLEERIQRLERRHKAQEEEYEAHLVQLNGREAAARKVREESREVRQQAKEQRQAYTAGVAETAGETTDQVRDRLVEAYVEETRATCADRLRNLESTSSEEFMRQAKRIMGIAMGRYKGQLPGQRLSSSVSLSSADTEKLTADPTTLTTLEELTTVRLILSDSGESLRLESGDGVAKELARRVLSRFLAKDEVKDLGQMISGKSRDLDREILKIGEDAFKLMRLELPHKEIVSLVGRLNYRTSYTQNQRQHAIEASVLAGLMAAELGLDVELARRATLMHDIGKALTHEVEGSHAVIGAEIARERGEGELIGNAIGSHHGDEPANSSYAYLVAASDAMSGARPGARREMVETYVDRIGDLERITAGFHGVTTVHAVQAGRELRVYVDEKQVNDAKASKLSDEIAAKISDELTFPGQILVTVIREFKAVEYAN